MLKRYRNEFLKEIQSSGLEVSDFSGKEEIIHDLPTFTITYKPGNLFFIARNNEISHSKFNYQYSRYTGTNDPFKIGPLPQLGWCAFQAVINAFRKWLNGEVRAALEEELIPDLWSNATSNLIGARPIDSQGTSDFTGEEKRQIKLAVANFRLLVVETFAPSKDQLRVVAEQMEYLSSAVDRLNRLDWKSVAISTLMSISIALSLDTEKGRQLYGLFQQAFRALSHLLR